MLTHPRNAKSLAVALREFLQHTIGRTGWQGTVRFWCLARARRLHARLRTGAALLRNATIIVRESGLAGRTGPLAKAIHMSLPASLFDRSALDIGTVPQLLHFVHFGREPRASAGATTWIMPVSARLAITTAMRCNPGWKALLYTDETPVGPEWASIAESVELVRLDAAAAHAPASLRRHGQLAYVAKLAILHKLGGACVDLRTLTLKPFEPICTADVVVGVKSADYPAQPILNDALLIARPGARTIGVWLKAADRVPLWRDAAGQRMARLPLGPIARRTAEFTILDHHLIMSFAGHQAAAVAMSPAGLRFATDLALTVVLQLERTADKDPLEDLTPEALLDNRSIYARIAAGRPPEVLPQESQRN